jgi:hypothetical protein
VKLPPLLVSIISKGIFRTLSGRGLIVSGKPAETVLKLEKLLLLDLQKDEELTARAKALLESRLDEIKAAGDFDFRLLLSKAKNELASKERIVQWGGSEKIPSEKVLQLSKEILECFKKDDELEYFTSTDNLRKEIAFALEKEKARDKDREQRAAAKVISIKRNIPEGSSEFVTLAEQFYREFLEKER